MIVSSWAAAAPSGVSAGLTNKSGLEMKLESSFRFLSWKQQKIKGVNLGASGGVWIPEGTQKKKKQGAKSNAKANWKTHA